MNKNTIKAPCTILLAAVNVIVFLVLSFLGMTEDGEFMLKHGAMYVPYLIQRGEYYRLFSSMFLHFGYDHLVNNMIVLIGLVGSEMCIRDRQRTDWRHIRQRPGLYDRTDIVLWIYQWWC